MCYPNLHRQNFQSHSCVNIFQKDSNSINYYQAWTNVHRIYFVIFSRKLKWTRLLLNINTLRDLFAPRKTLMLYFQLIQNCSILYFLCQKIKEMPDEIVYKLFIGLRLGNLIKEIEAPIKVQCEVGFCKFHICSFIFATGYFLS